jgi:uncharacterized protein
MERSPWGFLHADVLSGNIPGVALLALGVTAFLAALARGFSGFGSALIFIPMASAVVGPRAAAPLLLVVDGVLTMGFIPHAWRLADKREVAVMTLGLIAGVPVGTWLLASTDPIVIRWAIVVLAAVLVTLLMSGWRYHGKPTTMTTVAIGCLSGLSGGAAQMSGPPIIAYWLGGTIPATTVRANMILFFAIATVITSITYMLAGLLTTSILALALVTGPAFGLGLLIGSRLFGFASETTFRHACYALIAAAVILGLPAMDSVIR